VILRCLTILLTASFIGHPVLYAAQISPPILGYVFDSAVHGLRPIWGIWGSSTVGAPLDAEGIRLSLAAVSPGQDFALGMGEHNNQIMLLNLDQNPVAVTVLATSDSAIERVVFSPMGNAVVLVPENRQSLWLISGLPYSPRILDRIGLSTLPGTLGVLGVRDDGQQIILAMREGDGDAIYTSDSKGEMHGLARLGKITAIEYMRQGNDALIADAGTSEILRIRDTDFKMEPLATLASQGKGLGPMALAVSDDNQRLFIAAEGPAHLYVLNLQNRQVVHLPFSGKVTGLNRLKGNSVFRLNDFSGEPLLLLNGELLEPAVAFVPGLRKDTVPNDGLFQSPRGEPRPVRVRER